MRYLVAGCYCKIIVEIHRILEGVFSIYFTRYIFLFGQGRIRPRTDITFIKDLIKEGHPATFFFKIGNLSIKQLAKLK